MTKSFEEIRGIMARAQNFTMNDDDMTELWELAMEMDAFATDIFRTRDDEYIVDFMTLVQACALTHFVQTKDMDALKAVFLAQDDDVTKFIAMSIKLALGFAAMEELR